MSETPDRQYAHKIYPHPSEDETRPLEVDVPWQHPKCRLGIRDEYGHEHPATEEQA